MTNATQIIILGVFIFFLIVAVIVFALFGTGRNGSNAATVEIWGTMSEALLPRIAEAMNTANQGALKIHYREIEADRFKDVLTNALADGTGPDVVLMPETLLYQNRKRLALIGYNVYPQRDFKDTFIGASEVLLTDQGSYGLPFLADPIVMYWNRDTLSSANIAKPPATWEQVLSIVPKLSEVNDDKTIKRSAIGLGDSANISHSKEILSSLMLQAGSKMVAWNTKDEAKNMLDLSKNPLSNPIDDAIGFYTSFSNPAKPIYSWTRALPDSIDYFAAGDLALYFGFASDEARIRAKNPNLNFGVAILPQPGTSVNKNTFATVWSFSILASSRNQTSALNAISMLTSGFADQMASDATGLSPVRRDLLVDAPSSASRSVFYQSALFSSSWLDPEPSDTARAFESTIESVLSGQATVPDASRTLGKLIGEILDKI